MNQLSADRHAGAERLLLPVRDGAVAGWRWATPGAPQLVFLHATGFCALAYAAMFAAARRGFDIVALDLRGHGRTRLAADAAALRSWDLYADDLAACLDALPAPDAGRLLGGHSCGAVVVALAAALRSDIDGLALIEPVATPRWMSLAARTPLWPLAANRWPLVRGAKARRATFPDRAAATESYRRKAFFARWGDGVLEDYLEDGLLESGDGARLACEPRWEAATFAAQAHDFWGAIAGAIGRARIPVHVLIARDPSSTVSGGAARALSRYGAQVSVLAGVSHLAPLESPQQAAEFLLAARPAAAETR